MKYRVEHCDLFDYNKEGWYLAHCISADLALGKGIAVEFHKRFNMREKLRKRFPSGFIQPDGSFETMGCILEGNVLNLVTKANYWNKPKYRDMAGALYFMKEVCLSNNIKRVAMPKIGCGLDRLNWPDVEDLIHRTFSDTGIEIVVCDPQKGE